MVILLLKVSINVSVESNINCQTTITAYILSSKYYIAIFISEEVLLSRNNTENTKKLVD